MTDTNWVHLELKVQAVDVHATHCARIEELS